MNSECALKLNNLQFQLSAEVNDDRLHIQKRKVSIVLEEDWKEQVIMHNQMKQPSFGMLGFI